jgi:hypothetical protein
MTEHDREGRLDPSERAPSRDPDARFGLPDVDQDAGDEATAGPEVRDRFDAFTDNSNQNPGVAGRAAGPWPSSDAAPRGVDSASEGFRDEHGLRPRPGADADQTSETDP